MSSTLRVQMLGTFSVRYGEKILDDSSNRMKKVWLLLAYLIFCRNSPAVQGNYLSLLQGSGGEESVDPNGRLKAMFYRARTLLGQMDEEAGQAWIIRRNGTYAWNNEIPLVLDVEEFESLCRRAEAEPDEEEKLALCRKAVELYRGDFLPKLSMEPWVMPINTWYHQMFLNVAEQTLALLEKRGLWEEMSALCEKALKVEPYSEELYQHLMRARIARKDRQGARRAYEEMSDLLFSTFGVMPDEESRAIFREASREEEPAAISMGEMLEHLREVVTKGAMYCEYDFFKLLYQVQARSILRSGDKIHIALFSVCGIREKELARRSLDLVVKNLKELMLGNLRQGDVVTQCSASQLLVMLLQADYEDSCAVCRRILKAFARQYPHSPADINYSVQPLEPASATPEPET